MVKITNGTNVFEVTQGAFNDIYKHQGYREFDLNDSKEPVETKEPVTEELTEEEKFCVEVAEKPLASWNKDEVKRFAEIKGIDISGTKNANEAKDRIKAFLAE